MIQRHQHCYLPSLARYGGMVLLCAIATLLTAIPVDALAATTYCPNAPGVTDRVVTCIREALVGPVGGTGGILDAIYDAIYTPYKKTVFALITLSVAIYGLKMQLGMIRQIKTESIMLLIKIGLIVYFLDSFTTWTPKIFEGLEDLLSLVTTAAIPSDPDMSATCNGIDPGDPVNVWRRVDCAVGIVFGFGTATTLVSGLMGVVASSLFSDGSLGITVFLSGVATFLILLVSIFRAVYVYIAAMIAVTFLIAMAPLFVPLSLFAATRNYFSKWMQQITTYLIQPVFLFAFMSLMLASFNVAVITGEHSLATTLFGKHITSYSQWEREMKQFTRANVSSCDVTPLSLNLQPAQIKGSPKLKQKDPKGGDFFLPGIMDGLDIEETFGTDLGAGEFIGSIQNSVEGFMTFGITVMCNDFPKKTELYYSLIAIAVLAYVLYQLLEYIPVMAVDLSGAGSVWSYARLGGMAMPLEQRIGAGLQAGASSAMNQQGKSGGSTADQMNNLMQNALSGFVNPGQRK